MNPQSIKSNKQYRELLSIGNHKYDIPEPESGVIINQSLKYHFTHLPMDEKESFLDYQLDNNPLPKVFIMKVQSIRSSDVAESKIVDSWLQKVTTLSRLYRDKANRWFVDVNPHNPTDLSRRINEIKQFIEGKNLEETLFYLNFGLESLRQHYRFHELICDNPTTCATNKHYEELIDKLEAIINLIKSQNIEKSKKVVRSNKSNPEFTIARQVLALYYLLEYYQFPFNSVDKTALARFTQFLTGRHSDTDISNTNIYSKWKRVYSKTEKKQIQDLKFIKQYFIDLQLYEVAKMIDNDIEG